MLLIVCSVYKNWRGLKVFCCDGALTFKGKPFIDINIESSGSLKHEAVC